MGERPLLVIFGLLLWPNPDIVSVLARVGQSQPIRRQGGALR
jgi:hypothetical protein